jgi:anti-sigma factor RsiW
MSAVAQATRCCRYERWLTPFVDGELDAVHTIDVEAHLERCARCAEQVALARATRSSLRRVIRAPAPAALRDRVRAALREERATGARVAADRAVALGQAPLGGPPELVRLRYVMPLAVAALVALVVGGLQLRRDAGGAGASPAGSGAFMRASTLDALADELVSEHAHPPPPETTDPTGLGSFDPYVGVRVRAPELAQVGARFSGARLVRDAALLQYMMNDRRRVSVYVFDPSRVAVTSDRLRPRHFGPRHVYVGRVRGYSVAASVEPKGGIGFALASDLSDDESAHLALMAMH